MKFSKFCLYNHNSFEVWLSFSRTSVRNFLWCYYRWFITSLAQENERQILQNYIVHMKFSKFCLCNHNSFEVWLSFSRTSVRNFLWCYYRWFITSLAQENERQILQNYIVHMKFSKFCLCNHNSREIWQSFSRTSMRHFLWCYYRWFITSLALENCKKECNIL